MGSKCVCTATWKTLGRWVVCYSLLQCVAVWWETTPFKQANARSMYMLLKASCTPSSKILMYKKEKMTSPSPIMWHRYAKRTIGWLCPSRSPAGARRCEANHRGIKGEHRAQCARVRRSREEHTLIGRATKLGPVGLYQTQDCKLGTTIQDPPQSPEDRHVYFILLVRTAFYEVSKNLPLGCLFDVTMNIYSCFLCQNCTWCRHGFACIC